MATEFPEYVAELAAEMRELRRAVERVQRDLVELSSRLAEAARQPPPPASTSAEVQLSRLVEAVEMLRSLAEALAEQLAHARSAAAEERAKRDEICMEVLARLMALREALERLKP